MWPNLKAVLISGSTDSDPETSENIIRLTSMRKGVDLQHIHFDFRWKYDEQGPLGLRMLSTFLNHHPASMADAAAETNNYRCLRTLRLNRALIAPDHLHAAVQDSLAAGRLEALDIVFPSNPSAPPPVPPASNTCATTSGSAATPRSAVWGSSSFASAPTTRATQTFRCPRSWPAFPTSRPSTCTRITTRATRCLAS